MIHLRASFNFLCCSEDWRHLPRTDYCPAPADPFHCNEKFSRMRRLRASLDFLLSDVGFFVLLFV